MSKLRRPKSTLIQKDGESSTPDIKTDPKPSQLPTDGMSSNQPSTPTTSSNQEIVIMYPLEKSEKDDIIENPPDDQQKKSSSDDSPGLKAMLQQLMANQKNDTRLLQNEISGVSVKMTKKMETTEKITLSANNLWDIIQETARDFQQEIDKVNTKL